MTTKTPESQDQQQQGISILRRSTPEALPTARTDADTISAETGASATESLKPFTESLPVLNYRDQILESVKASAVTIVTAATGAGKSTQVPRFLAEEGYKVIVTQPRRLAARTVASRVAQEMKTPLGAKVGYRTAEDRRDSAATQILFCTDGLQLVRELTGQKTAGGKTVLVLDEVHEWNVNMEVLIAWARKRIQAGEDLKIVVMSATLDTQALSEYFGRNAPVVDVPGRLYPVEKLNNPANILIDQAAKLATEGRNVLVFQPGKREIENTIEALQKKVSGNVIILPLHGELTAEDQQACFAPAPAGKSKIIVATNVAQTSVTIPDIDAVVDSGLEKRIELNDGIEGIYLKPISKADCEQRAGRAGRCRPGVYVLCSDINWQAREDFPKAEILRTRLDQTVLRLAAQGFKAGDLKFFHQPDQSVLQKFNQSLTLLGAIDDKGVVTKIGKRIAKLPVAAQYGRMLIEAEKHGVVSQVATIAACLEAGDIRSRDEKWKELTTESESDLLAILDVYIAAKNLPSTPGRSKADTLREAGIFAKDYFRAQELRGKILDAVRGEVDAKQNKFESKEEERKAIVKSIVAGMVDHVYKNDYGSLKNGDGEHRELDKKSVCSTRSSEWFTGLPLDIGIQTKRGPQTLNFVTMATAVTPELLEEVAPQLVTKQHGNSPTYSQKDDSVFSTTKVLFNGRQLKEGKVPDKEHPQAATVFAEWASNPYVYHGNTPMEAVSVHNKQIQNLAKDLNTRHGSDIFKIPTTMDQVRDFFTRGLQGARCIAEIPDFQALFFPPLDQNLVEKIQAENPKKINIGEQEFEVFYKEGTMPQLQFRRDWIDKNLWKSLPDEDLTLPGGKKLFINIYISYDRQISGSDIPTLKQEIIDYLNDKIWDDWEPNSELIKLPDLDSENPQIQNIVTVQYGSCIDTGNPLMAHGCVEVNNNRYYTSDEYFKGTWESDLEEAQEKHRKAVELLAKLQNEKLERQAYEKLKIEAQVVIQEADDLYHKQSYYDLSEDSRTRIYKLRAPWLPEKLSDLKNWITETRKFFTNVEAEIAVIAERKRVEDEQTRRAEELRIKQEAEQAVRADAKVSHGLDSSFFAGDQISSGKGAFAQAFQDRQKKPAKVAPIAVPAAAITASQAVPEHRKPTPDHSREQERQRKERLSLQTDLENAQARIKDLDSKKSLCEEEWLNLEAEKESIETLLATAYANCNLREANKIHDQLKAIEKKIQVLENEISGLASKINTSKLQITEFPR